VARRRAAAHESSCVDWIAVPAFSGFPGHKASEAIKNKVRGILSTWRLRHGQAKVDEVKGRLIQQLHASKSRTISDDELQKRVESLFCEPG
jgi:hypothetical protein